MAEEGDNEEQIPSVTIDKKKAQPFLLLVMALLAIGLILMALHIENKYNDLVVKYNECKQEKTGYSGIAPLSTDMEAIEDVGEYSNR